VAGEGAARGLAGSKEDILPSDGRALGKPAVPNLVDHFRSTPLSKHYVFLRTRQATSWRLPNGLVDVTTDIMFSLEEDERATGELHNGRELLKEYVHSCPINNCPS
jgi:hypothetical protein